MAAPRTKSSVGTDAANSTAGSTVAAPAVDGSADASGDTITVDNFGDMPPKCIDLLSTFLKKIEPTAASIDWENATLADFEDFGKQFQTDTDAFDSQTAAAGCDKYNLSGSDEQQFQQMAELASVEAPGALGFIKFLEALSASATASGGSVPTDCAGTIALIEPYLKTGTMKDLTMAQVTTLGQLMTGVSNNCTSEEASAFFGRADVSAYISG